MSSKKEPLQDQFIHAGAIVKVARESSSSKVLATWQGTVRLLEGTEAITTRDGIVMGTRHFVREVPAAVCTVVGGLR